MRGSVNTEDDDLGRERLCLVLYVELMLGTEGVVSGLVLCIRTTEHAGSPGILAVVVQRIEPAPMVVVSFLPGI